MNGIALFVGWAILLFGGLALAGFIFAGLALIVLRQMKATAAFWEFLLRREIERRETRKAAK